MTNEPASSARVPTDRGARYGKQLASHLGRRAVSQWDELSGSGTIEFGSGRAELSASADALLLRLWTESSPDIERLEDVVGRHLVRFGARGELVVRWTRADGRPGTEQRKLDDSEGAPAR